MSCQIQSGNLNEFFSHENQSFPQALSDSGKLNSGKKSDILGCFEERGSPVSTTQPAVDSVILDGAAIVHISKANNSSTFGSYISSQLKNATRCDIVWDVYQDGSLKTGTCEKRGISRKQRVEPSSKIPKDWGDF